MSPSLLRLARPMFVTEIFLELTKFNICMKAEAKLNALPSMRRLALGKHADDLKKAEVDTSVAFFQPHQMRTEELHFLSASKGDRGLQYV